MKPSLTARVAGVQKTTFIPQISSVACTVILGTFSLSSAMANVTQHHDWQKPTATTALILESWSEGTLLGALLVTSLTALANVKKGVLLHKLIFVELLIAMPDCFAIFNTGINFGRYLSSTSLLVIVSWQLHSIISWIKNKPFLDRKWSLMYISTVALVQPYWVWEIYANFAYYNDIEVNLFPKTRPFEPLFRDPWWIFTCFHLLWNIKYRYSFSYRELIKVSPRFGIMLLAMLLAIIFTLLDILSVTSVLHLGGLNPFWKLSFIFKGLTDTIILDDFKTALDKISIHHQQKLRLSSDQPSGIPLRGHAFVGAGTQHWPKTSQSDILKQTSFQVRHVDNVHSAHMNVVVGASDS